MIVLIKENEKLNGFVFGRLKKNSKNIFVLDSLGVEPKKRQQGLAEKLMQKIIANIWARLSEIKKINFAFS